MMKGARVLLIVLVFAGADWTAQQAQACSFPGPQPHTLDPQAQATDSTPPGAPVAVVTNIKRGVGPKTDGPGCGQSASSCDDLGTVTLQLTASDDQTPLDQLGYTIELAAGKLPDGLVLPAGAVRAPGQTLTLLWIDGSTDNQEAVSFSLMVRAVDLAGNVGPATTVAVSDPGSGTACTVATGRLGESWPTTVLAILLAAHLWRRGLRRWASVRRKD